MLNHLRARSGKQTWLRLAIIIGLALALLLTYLPPVTPYTPTVNQLVKAQSWKVLVFSKTLGFRHDSIPQGIQAVRDLGAANGFGVDATEDAAVFSDAGLASYAAVIWLSTTGDVLDATQQAAFERYIKSGKGYVGFHAASDTEYSWAWYGNLVGAYFNGHPLGGQQTFVVEDKVHPSTTGMADRWVRDEPEWYNFSPHPRNKVHVLVSMDEAPGAVGGMGADHPISWCQRYDGGRSWYTAMGHSQATYGEAQFRNHMLGGIRWAAGQASGNCDATRDASFQKVILDQNVNDSLVEPLDLEVLPDGRVIYVTRRGVIKIWRPTTNSAVTAATLPVSTQFEDGLSGIVQDPSFATNRYIYLYYMTPVDPAMARVSRFTVVGDTVDLATEAKIIEWPVTRGGGHTGGGLAFDENGNLFIASGDNKGATGYMQTASLETSGNTNDLRGKILRVKPGATGGYTVPTGNLFPAGTARTRPEIYGMGFRNPYRIHYDAARKALYVGDVGPDASEDGADGPRGHDEYNMLTQPGNYGWPHCIANNIAYAGQNCSAPVNNHALNTGLNTLPAARPAWIWYHGTPVEPFPELGGGARTAIPGPTYHYNPNSSSAIKFPSYFDNTIFLTEFSRSWIREVKLDAAGNILKINPVGTNLTFNAPISVDFGPDGALYFLEYAGWFNGSSNTRLSRVEYRGGQTGQAPVAMASSTPDSGRAPLTVQFSSAGSHDPDGGAITYAWDFDGNGTVDSTAANPSYVYNTIGSFTARLTVTDPAGLKAGISIPIVVGNTRPVVNITAPPEGIFAEWGTSISYSITVSDAEDGSTGAGTIDCTKVILQPAVGHDDHAHPLQQIPGCSGSFAIPPSGHTEDENVFLILSASYTDKGATGAAAMSGSKTIRLQPRRKQAEHATTMSGVRAIPTLDQAGGLQDIGDINAGEWIAFSPINLQTMTGVRYRVGAMAGGTIEMRVGSATGTLINSVSVPANQGYIDLSANWSTTPPAGAQTIYVVFNGGAGELFRLNWIDFRGPSTITPTPTNVFTPCNKLNNIALGKTTTATSFIATGAEANKATDGNTSSRWESVHGVDPQWIQVDLGSVQTICRVLLNWEPAYGSAYRIDVSNDNATWTTIYSTTTGNGAIDDLTVSGSGRYVRMYGTTRATPYGYSLWEFEVYSGSTPPPVTNTPTRTSTSGPSPTRTSTSGPGNCGTTNAALGKTSQALSILGGNTANMTFDGVAGTRWESVHAVDPQWIYVDLGSVQTICRVLLSWEGAFGSAYELQVSNDAAAWTTVKAVTGENGGLDDHAGLNAAGRYVRMYGTARGTQWGYSLWEMEVYTGTTPPPATFTPTRTNTAQAPATNTATRTRTSTAGGVVTATATRTRTSTTGGATATRTRTATRTNTAVTSCGTTNKALGKTALSSSDENAGTTANLAVDGNAGTRWASQFSDPQWIRVDLGSTQSICRVRLNWEAAYGKAYQIQTSNDGATWTTIYSTTTSDGGIDDLTNLAGSGRYVRMYGTVRALGYGYSLWELEVY